MKSCIKFIKKDLEYYYMFYVSQLAMKLKNFEKADVTTPDKLYYTLSWKVHLKIELLINLDGKK